MSTHDTSPASLSEGIGERAAARASATVAAGDSPRTVITGGKIGDDTSQEASERYELRARGFRGGAKIVAIPLPRQDAEPFGAITDYLNCTFPIDESAAGVRRALDRILPVLGTSFEPISDRGRGLYGYHRSFQLGRYKTFFAAGGNCETAFLSLPGEACNLVNDWDSLAALLRDRFRGRITRWDGAVDDYLGKRGVDWAVEQYKSGGFNAGGTQPRCRQNGNWIKPDGKGRTLYIGERKNGKMGRIYEKGKQLGDPSSPWTRFEVELHNRDREIPWDVLQRPGCYVAGAYLCLSWVHDEMSRIKTLKRTAQIGYDYLTRWARVSYGRHLNVMLTVEGSADEVLKKLVRPGIPSRLDIATPSESNDE